MGLFKKDENKARRKLVSRKISKHMKKNKIHGSDGLEVDKDGNVYYDKNRDDRNPPEQPPNTPPGP